MEFFGRISRTDPVGAATLDAMARAGGGLGCDGAWIREGAALGRTVLRAASRTVPPVPLPEWEGGVLVARARLDNREDLAQALGMPFPEMAPTPDEDIVLAALRKWGNAAPTHLAGDWCYAHWDPASRTLLLARDAWGHAGLYYHASASERAPKPRKPFGSGPGRARPSRQVAVEK